MKPEDRRDIARRLIAEAGALVERQRKLVAELEKGGHSTESALQLLAHFEQAHDSFRRTLALFQKHAPRYREPE